MKIPIPRKYLPLAVIAAIGAGLVLYALLLSMLPPPDDIFDIIGRDATIHTFFRVGSSAIALTFCWWFLGFLAEAIREERARANAERQHLPWAT